MTTRKDQIRIERLERLLEAERARADKEWAIVRDLLIENVDLKMRMEAVQRALQGEIE